MQRDAGRASRTVQHKRLADFNAPRRERRAAGRKLQPGVVQALVLLM
jgi:hypothetical protein